MFDFSDVLFKISLNAFNKRFRLSYFLISETLFCTVILFLTFFSYF